MPLESKEFVGSFRLHTRFTFVLQRSGEQQVREADRQ